MLKSPMCSNLKHMLFFFLQFVFFSVCLIIPYGFKPLLQAHALKMVLQEKNLPVNVYVGMRYWYPFTEEAVQQVCFAPFSSGLPSLGDFLPGDKFRNETF